MHTKNTKGVASFSDFIQSRKARKLSVCLVLCFMAIFTANAAEKAVYAQGKSHSYAPHHIERLVEDTLTPLTPAKPVNIKYLNISELRDSIPASFDSISPNVIVGEELLLPAAKILVEGERPLRVLHLGDSHVAGKSLPRAVKEVLTDWLGEADSAGEGSGINFLAIGSNGATSRRFLSGDYMQRISDFHPDLIILSLGTNEAHGMGYLEDVHSRQLDKFFAVLGSVCPDASLLLTTPPGDYLAVSGKGKQRVKRPNPMVVRCAANIVSYGKEHGMATWDLNTICGGEVAVTNWIKAGLMRPDRVHFLPEGYAVQGHLLGNAIVRTLVRLARQKEAL